MKGSPSHKFLLCLSQWEIKKLKTISKERGISVSEIIRRVLDEYLEKRE